MFVKFLIGVVILWVGRGLCDKWGWVIVMVVFRKSFWIVNVEGFDWVVVDYEIIVYCRLLIDWVGNIRFENWSSSFEGF